MLVATPELSAQNLAQLERIWLLQKELAPQLNEPKIWTGTLRRQALGRAMRYSVGIEGYGASESEANEVLLSETSPSLPQSTISALNGYRQAMGFVLAQATRENFELDQTFLRAVHFMTLNGNPVLGAGNYRSSEVFVREQRSGDVVHEGADHGLLSGLMGEFVHRYRNPGLELGVVTAAMAHLNLVLIHPFTDGNGRVARVLQSTVLAGHEKPSPLFLSIEEYLGLNTQAYYAVLAEVGGGSWNSASDARPWLSFVLNAHLEQLHFTRAHWQRLNQTWSQLAGLVLDLGLSERVVPALVHAAGGQRLTNTIYRQLLLEASDEVSLLTASRDLALLVEKELLMPKGENKARHYLGGKLLRAALSVEN